MHLCHTGSRAGSQGAQGRTESSSSPPGDPVPAPHTATSPSPPGDPLPAPHTAGLGERQAAAHPRPKRLPITLETPWRLARAWPGGEGCASQGRAGARCPDSL